MKMTDFSKVIKFSNGVRVINVTPHVITFLDGESVVEVAPCGALVGARAVEMEAGQQGAAQLVKTVFSQSEQGLAELEEINREVPGVLVVGSIISAQGYPGQVVGMTSAPGFERVAPAEKRMSILKFTTF